MAFYGPAAPPLFQALKARWDARHIGEKFIGGYWDDDPPEDQTTRPFIVVRSVSDAPFLWTNRGRYDRVRFTVAVTADSWDTIPTGPDVGLDVLLPLLAAATEFAPLAIPDRGLRKLRPGPTMYETNKNIHRATTEYEALVAGGYVLNP